MKLESWIFFFFGSIDYSHITGTFIQGPFPLFYFSGIDIIRFPLFLPWLETFLLFLVVQSQNLVYLSFLWLCRALCDWKFRITPVNKYQSIAIFRVIVIQERITNRHFKLQSRDPHRWFYKFLLFIIISFFFIILIQQSFTKT